MKASLTATLLWSFFFISCTRLSNGLDSFKQQCGEAAEFDLFQYFRVLGPNGETLPNDDLRMHGLHSSLTSKGCLKVARSSNEAIAISYPRKSYGMTIHPNRDTKGLLTDVKLQAFAYKSLQSKCALPIATQGPAIEPQVDLNGQNLAGYAWEIELLDANGALLREESNSDKSQELSLLDVRPLPDGRYTLQMRFQQLHSVDRLENVITCQIFIDRKSPVFSLKGLKRVDSRETSPSIIGPGETIQILVDDPGTDVHVFGCLARMRDGVTGDCTFERLDDRILTAPASGEWILRGYAVDAANNQGPLAERHFQILDSNAVSAIKVLTQQAEFSVSTGQGMTSILSAVQSYEKFLALGSREEHAAVKDDVRRALLETSVLPREELYFALVKPEQRQGIGMMETSRGMALASIVSNEATKEISVALAPVSGDEEVRLHMEQLGTLYPAVSTCGDKSSLALFGSAGMIPVVKGEAGSFIKFNGTFSYAGFGLTADCRYAYFSLLEPGEFVPKKTTVVDLSSGRTYPGVPYLVRVYRAVGPDSVRVKLNRDFSVLNLETGASRSAFPAIASSDIKELLTTYSGEVALLTKDKTLHTFNSEFSKTAQIADVESIHAASTPREIIAVVNGGYTVRIIKVDDGKVTAQVNDAFKDIAYLGADRGYLVFKDNSLSRVKVYQRNGYPAPEQIYSLDSQLSNVWIADPGYLYLQNVRFMKVYQLDSAGLFLKKAPPLMTAVGMEFLDDDQLVFKSQAVRSIDFRTSDLESTINIWNLGDSTLQTHPLPILHVDEALNISPFAGYSRDIQLFQGTQGQPMIAAVFGRGSLGIFEAGSLGTLVLQNKICTDWAFDLDIAVNGSIGAMACAEGFVRIFDTQSLQVLASYHIEGSYPINVGFDSSAQHLFATDFTQSLRKLSFDAATNHIMEDHMILDAGMRLAMNPDRTGLAVLGSSSKLHVYNTELTLQRDPIPANNQFSLLALSLTYDPSGSKVFAGMYDGAVTEIDLATGRSLRIRFSASDDGALALKVSPNGQKLAFYGKGSAQVWELNMEAQYAKICRWLKPRLRYFANLPGYAPELCKSAS